MSELRFTDTNAGDDSSGRVFGLDGNLYLPVVLGLVLGILLFAGMGLGGVGYMMGAAVASLPILGSLVWIVGFRHGKPAGYDKDKIDHLLGGASFTREAFYKTDTKAHTGAPEGRFVRGMLVFGSPERGGSVAKGFRLERPDLRGASFERLNAFQKQGRALLALLSPGWRLQIQWWADANYRRALLDYHARTQDVKNPAVRAIRNERFARFWRRMVWPGDSSASLGGYRTLRAHPPIPQPESRSPERG